MKSAPVRGRAAVTGANGFLGSLVLKQLLERGWAAVGLSRSQLTETRAAHMSFSLGDPLPPDTFSQLGVTTLVHCAYDFRPLTWSDIYRVNVQGSIDLLKAAVRQGVRQIVVISSISAFDGCESLYGKAKLEIERAALDAGAVVVRPGLIYSDTATGGMFGSLQASLEAHRFVPMIGSGAYPQYLVHAQDLLDVILRGARGSLDTRGKVVTVANPRPWPMLEILKVLAAKQGVKRTFVPVPWRAVWIALKVAETLGIKTGFRSDSVISLVKQNPAPDFSHLQSLGSQLRDICL